MKKIIISVLIIISVIMTSLAHISYAADIRSLVNNEPLSPIRNEFYGDKIDEILTECGYGKEYTYTVLKNCYTWLVNNVRYREDDDPYAFMSMVFSIVPDQTYINSQAYSALYQGYGVCNEYAGALYIMAQTIGLKPYYCLGQTKKADGSYTGHAWVEIELAGQLHVFDAQVEDNVAKGGTINYYYFGKTRNELNGSHILDEELFTAFRVANGYCSIGEEIGSVYSTDIVTYINGYPINTYSVNNSLYIIANDLEKYGAKTEWKENEKCLNISMAGQTLYAGNCYNSSLAYGTEIGKIYYSDIKVSFEGSIVNSYNMGNYMLLYVGDLDKFGELSANSDNSEIHFTYGSIVLDKTSLSINAGETAQVTAYAKDVSVESSNVNIVTVINASEVSESSGYNAKTVNLLAVSAGTAELTFTSGSRTAKCIVTVTGEADKSDAVALREKSIMLKAGEQSEIYVDCKKPIGKNLIAAAYFYSEDETILKILTRGAGENSKRNDNGEYVFESYALSKIQAVKPGQTRIKVLVDNTFEDYVTVTVTDNNEFESGISYPYNSVSADTFNDIDKSSKYYEPIDYLCKHSVLAGYDDNTFKPDDYLKRSEFAAIISRIMGDEYIAGMMAGDTKFTDVLSDHWASGYVNYCVENQMIDGMDNNFYGADSYLTNIQAIKIILSALNYPIPYERDSWNELEDMFFGVDYWTFFWNWYWNEAVNLGLWTDESVEKNITRAELAQLIYRALDIEPLNPQNIPAESGTFRERTDKPYNFKDSAMEYLVRIELQKPKGPIRLYEMKNVSDLNAENLHEGEFIEILDDIMYMPNISNLKLRNQHIASIEPLMNINLDDGTYKRFFSAHARIDLYGNYILDISKVQEILDAYAQKQYCTIRITAPFTGITIENQMSFDSYNRKISDTMTKVNEIVSDNMTLEEKWEVVNNRIKL